MLPSAGVVGLGQSQPCWNILTKFLMATGEEAQRGHLFRFPYLGVNELELWGKGEGDMTGSRSHSKLVAESGLEFSFDSRPRARSG